MATTKIRGNRQIQDGTIEDTQIASGAAIALSKLAEAVIQADGGQAFTADQSMGSHKLTSVTDPTSAQDAATKNYVDGLVTGLAWKNAVRAATTANVALTGTQTIDGVSLSAGQDVLVKNQTAPAENGIYTVAAGAWARRSDANSWAELVNAAVFVQEGTTNADTGWVATQNIGGTLETTAVAFTQFTGGGIVGGSGLTLTGSTLDVNVDSTTIEISSDTLRVAATAAGNGLTGGGGSALAVGGGNGITVGADTVTVLADPTPASITVGAAGIKVTTTIRVVRETPSGTIDGANTTFGLAATPSPVGSEEVFLNGILQEPGAGNDYTISGATITYLTAPASGDRLRVNYMRL